MKKPAPKTVVIDPRAVALAEIDAEITRLRGLANARQAELDDDVAKHITLQDHGLQSRLDRECTAIQSKIEALDQKRFAIELENEVEDPSPSKSRQPKAGTVARWNLRGNLQDPKYPAGARAAGRKKEIDAAFDQFRDFGLALADEHFSKLGTPTTPVDMSLLAVVSGVELGNFLWLSARIAEAEQRLAELEERSKGVPYKGVWSPDVQYKAGSFVSHGGSLWHADVDVKGARPGDGALWQLAVKRGRDARP